MKTFAYRGYDGAGRAMRGLIEAHEPKEAREKLIKQGVFAEELKDSAESGGGGGRRGFGLAVRAATYRQLAVLLKSGLPLAAALDVLIQSPDGEVDPALLAGTRDRLKAGQSFADALKGGDAAALSAFEHAIVQAGEKTGNLDAVLEQLAGYLDEQQTLNEGIRSATMYPVLVIGLAVFVAVGMLGFVVPSLSKMFMESRIELPALTRAVVWASRWFWALAGVLGGVAWLVWSGWRARWRDVAARERIEQRLFSARWLGRGLRLMCGVRFARTMSLLLRGGVQLVDGLEIAGRATGSVWLARLLTAEAEAMRHGRSFAQALRQVPPLSGLLASWVQAGEASGSLDTLLHTAAERMQYQWSQFLSRALNLIGPVLILAVGAFVLVIALAILLPILSLTQSVH